MAVQAEQPLPWSRLGNRCRATVEANPSGYWGRCDLRRGHDGLHALERGFLILRWSTAWITEQSGWTP